MTDPTPSPLTPEREAEIRDMATWDVHGPWTSALSDLLAELDAERARLRCGHPRACLRQGEVFPEHQECGWCEDAGLERLSREAKEGTPVAIHPDRLAALEACREALRPFVRLGDYPPLHMSDIELMLLPVRRVDCVAAKAALEMAGRAQ